MPQAVHKRVHWQLHVLRAVWHRLRLERLVGGSLNDLEAEPTSGFSIEPTRTQGEMDVKKSAVGQRSGEVDKHE